LGDDVADHAAGQLAGGDQHFFDAMLAGDGGQVGDLPQHGRAADAVAHAAGLVGDEAHRQVVELRVGLNGPHEGFA